MIRSCVLLFGGVLAGSIPSFALSVGVTPDKASPQTVGTTINLTAFASGGSGSYDYQFAISRTDTPQVVQDFNVANTLAWVPSVKEGTYTIIVTARDLANTSQRASTAISYTIFPALNQGAQALHTTNNPMVALFSAPPCPTGLMMRVVFYQAVPNSRFFATNNLNCDGVTSMNFLIAGMYANSTYNMFWQTLNGTTSVLVGALMQFTTGPLPPGVAFPSTVGPAPNSPSPTPPIEPFPLVMEGFLPGQTPYTMAAVDLLGKPVWVLPYVGILLTRTDLGGKILFLQTPLVQTNPVTPNPWAQQLREVDLAGNQLLQTNASIVSEQLVAMGKHPITAFHHELIPLPGGKLLTLGAAELMVQNANQCGTTNNVPNTCDVIGDVVIVLDSNLQLLWAYDPFLQGTYSTPGGSANLLNNVAVLGETCVLNGPGCPPIFKASVANDWMHTNALQYTADGNIIMGVRHLDWILKINYGNGLGDGHIMWRLGRGGDFALTTNSTVGSGSDPDFASFPWFSHPHGTKFAFNDALIGGVQILICFDNGNTRIAQQDPNGHSRAQVYAVNEPARQVNLNTDIDLGAYSFALGSIQFTPNGNLWSDLGAIGPKPGPWSGQNVEASNGTGNILYILQLANGTSSSFLTYRSWRLPSMYSPSP